MLGCKSRVLGLNLLSPNSMKRNIFRCLISNHFTSFYKWIMNHSKPQASPNITMEKRASIKVARGCFIIFGGESRRNDRPSHETCSQRAVLRIATEGPRKVCFGGWNMAIGKKTCSGKCCDLHFQVFSIYIYLSKLVHLDLLFVWINLSFCISQC